MAARSSAFRSSRTVGFDERDARSRRIREHAALGPQAEEDAPDVEQDRRASEGEDVKGIGAKHVAAQCRCHAASRGKKAAMRFAA